MVAVVVDHALAVTEEITLPLQPLIEIIGIDRGAARDTGIDDLDAVPLKLNAGIARGLADLLLTAQKNGRTKLLVCVSHRSSHDLLFLALREDDALGMAAYALIDALEGCGDRVATGGQLLRVALEIDDRL